MGGALALQGHGSTVRYRNIWVVKNKLVPIPATARVPGRLVRPALSSRPAPAGGALYSVDGKRIPGGRTRGLRPACIRVNGGSGGVLVIQ